MSSWLASWRSSYRLGRRPDGENGRGATAAPPLPFPRRSPGPFAGPDGLSSRRRRTTQDGYSDPVLVQPFGLVGRSQLAVNPARGEDPAGVFGAPADLPAPRLPLLEHE